MRVIAAPEFVCRQEAAALIKELADITGNDRYPFSPQNLAQAGRSHSAVGCG
jgi:hypothetical protein